MLFPGDQVFPGVYPGVTVGNSFTPPVSVRTVRLDGALRGQYLFGVAVLRINGEWVETEYPSEQQVAAADLYFPGGYVHTVDDDTAAALTAAGYEVE